MCKERDYSLALMPKRRALITGVGGQDGVLLARLLLEKDYEVAGITRRPIEEHDPEVIDLVRNVDVIDADLLDPNSLTGVLDDIRPIEIYNLAAPSFVPQSWEEPVLTAQFAAVGVTSLLEAIRASNSKIRLYQASSSEIFGEPQEIPQTESTPLAPITPYGVAKAYAHFIVRGYRRRYGIFGCCGILYNHESPRRPLSFLPRKVAHGAAAIRLGQASELVLGDLGAKRDWGLARDYVQAMWLMMQAAKPDDYVIATGELHSVEELVEIAFRHLGLDWRDHVRSSGALRRGTAELHNLVGKARKAQSELGWRPTMSFEELVHHLVDVEVERVANQQAHFLRDRASAG